MSLKKKSAFKRIFSDNAYCFLAFGCVAGLMLLVFYCYDVFPFGDKTVLRMDLYHQYGPLFAEFYDRVTHLESLIYSWRSGLGAPFLGNYFNYLSSPAALIILLLGHENMPESIAAMIVLKAMCSAFTFTYYLKKSQGKSDFITASFGVLYSMCGYFLAYYWNVMWMDAMVYFPLIVLGIENIVDRQKCKTYIAFLALTLLSNYYMGYMACIMSVLYFIAYYFSKYSFGTLAPDTVYYYTEKGKKKYKFGEKLKGNVLLRSGGLFAVSSVAAACLVAFALIPTFFILKSCSATGSEMPKDYKTYFSIFDFLANHLGSVDPTIRSSGDDVMPNVYCGIATLLLVPLYLFTRSVSLKEKISNISLLAVFFVSFNFNYTNFIWHGLHFPNDLPYRFSFMYSFILLVISYKAFTRLNEFNGRQILGAGCCLLFAIIMIQENGSKNVEDITILLSIIFTVTYTIVCYLMKSDRYQKGSISILMLCCVIGEIACCNTDRYVMNQFKTNFCGDYSEFRAVKRELDLSEGTDKYRMELTYNRARMDPCWYGYNGISVFSSMAYEKMANVQNDLGVNGNYINSYTYYLQTPVYNMMNGLKYIVNNDADVTVTDDYYTKVCESGAFTAYENKYSLPIAMSVSKDIKSWYSNYSSPFVAQGDWFEYATGVSDVFSLMKFDEIRYFNMDEITSGLDTGDLYFTKTGEGEGELTFNLSVEEDRHCYIYVNSVAFDKITITQNGDEKEITTDDPYIYDLGRMNEEDELSVKMTIKDKDYGYIDFYPVYVDDEKLDEGYEILKKSCMQILSFEDTKITGRVNNKADSMVFTSIPYDKGWTVYVDGEAIAEDDYVALCDAYLSFKVPAGAHTIEMSFSQPGLLIGVGVSLSTVLVLVLVSLVTKRKKAIKEKRKYAALLAAELDYIMKSSNMNQLTASESHCESPEEPVSQESIS